MEPPEYAAAPSSMFPLVALLQPPARVRMRARTFKAAQFFKRACVEIRDVSETARPTSLIKRFLTSDEVANAIAYLCTPAASGTTGSAIRVDGGVVRAP